MKVCKGDFCKVILKSSAKLSEAETDYENLVSLKQLEQVRNRYFSSEEQSV